MSSSTAQKSPKTNYIAYTTSSKIPRIGHLDFTNQTITPLSYASGTPLSSLYQVISAHSNNNIIPIVPTPFTSPLALSSVTLLPPLSGRDILAVGKNYHAHAAEFNKSGYDSSDKVDTPSHPVIFTKRATSIIASGAAIYPHAQYGDTLDYEGEIGVILSKAGYGISKADAWDHVWGYTIINDVTSRNEQRDHKQFFLGKSADTYCPMGPVACRKEELDGVLRVETYVNGDKRQEGTTQDLIFDVPTLVQTVSAAQTVRAGDVIATGTPAGVGFGFTPPRWLREGDEVRVAVTGLGELVNTVGSAKEVNVTTARVKEDEEESYVPVASKERTTGLGVLTMLPGKKELFYRAVGKEGGPPVMFVHGLGGSSEYFSPLVSLLQATHRLHLLDLEGHGLSPTKADSTLSIDSFARDVEAVIAHAGVKNNVTLIAHSMGCLVALKYAIANSETVSAMVLMGPPPSPLPKAAAENNHKRAALVREKGMPGVVDTVIGAGLSGRTKTERPVGVAATRLSLLGTDPEGYAKACTALAESEKETLDVQRLKGKKLLCLTGDEDKVGPEAICKGYAEKVGDGEVKVLTGVGHWHLFEDVDGCRHEIGKFFGIA